MDNEVLTIIENEFGETFRLLDDYDNHKLEMDGNIVSAYKLEYDEAIELVNFSNFNNNTTLYGIELKQTFESTLNTIYQTFESQELYPSLEDKASNLLYLLVKNHSFVDGNKRIAAYVFLYYLYKNKYLSSNNMRTRLDSKTLSTIIVLIAISEANEKEIIVSLIKRIIFE